MENQQIELIRREMPQSKPSTTSLQQADWIPSSPEKDIYLSNFNKKLVNYNDVHGVKDIIGLLGQWVVYLGIKDISPEDLELCRKFLLDEYSDWTLEKIRLAIKYSLRGELKGADKKPLDIKPYGSFSPMYISSVLNAFKRYSQKVEHDILLEKKRLIEKEFNEVKDRTPEQEIEGRRKYLSWYINLVARNEEFKIDFKNVAWNFVTRNGYLDPKNIDKPYLRKYADMMLKRVKNPFEIELTTIDEWEQLMRYRLHVIFFRLLRLKLTNEVLIQKLQDVTNEQIML